MKQMVGLKNYGSLTMRVDNQLAYDWLMESEWEQVSYIAPGEIPHRFLMVDRLGIEYNCFDMNPMYKGKFIICDVIFDYPEGIYNNILNFNCHKMYPIGKLYRGEFILIGSDDRHPGDCNPVDSCDQLIEQNLLTTVYKQAKVSTDRNNFYLVSGNNL